MIFKKHKDKEIKKWHIVVIGFVVVFSFILKAYYAYIPKADLLINENTTVRVLLADNYRRWYKGLSGKKDLGNYVGMLFIFPQSGRHDMVMRDMEFPLDIIWIKDNTIVEIIRDIKPEPNTADSALKRYYSIKDADQVLEVKSGYVNANNIKVGDSIVLLKE